MNVIFADAGYWIAPWNPRDALHRQALAIADRVGAMAVVTTRLVLVEALDFMAGVGEFRRGFAAQMVQALEKDPTVEIIPLSDTHFRAALERYASRSDQRWSLTDCASFLVMEEHGITKALAFDRDFEQAGFVALLRDGPA